MMLFLSSIRSVLIAAAVVAMMNHSPAAPVTFVPQPEAGAVDNPLKGFVPYAGSGRDFPHSLEFAYLPLAAVMRGRDTFDWTALEKLLNDISSRGCQSIFRFHIEYPGKPSGLPAYLIGDGLRLREWTDASSQPPARNHTPDYEDPRLRGALTSFIAALGKRYDGDPRIGFITAGLLGSWGEWHCYPHPEWFASKTVQKEIMDGYEAAFHITPVLLRYPAGDHDSAHAANAERGFGYHDDSFAWATLETGRKEDAWFYLSLLNEAGPAARERWKAAPIGGEIRPELWPCLWKENACGAGQDFQRCVRETHVTWLMDSSTSRPLAPVEKERAMVAARSLGYELQVVSASAEIKDGTLEVAATVINRGVAPFYAGWPVQVRVLADDGTARSAALDLELKSLLPGSSKIGAAKIDLTNLPATVLSLQLGVLNPLPAGRPLRFANVSSNPVSPGWLTLGKLSLKP